MNPMKRLPLQTIVNCRDLGGFPCVDGGATAFGRVLRCGIPVAPSEADIAFLYEYGVRAVIDLRGDYEAEKAPSSFLRHPEFAYTHLSLYEINPAVLDASRSLWDVYENSVEHYQANYLTALRNLAKQSVPTLIHCFLGKDRTGILSALLLSLAGVSDADIIADYQVSATYLRPFYKLAADSEKRLLWEGNREHLDSPAEHMRKLLAFLRERYPSAPEGIQSDKTSGAALGYVRRIGLTEAEIETLRALLRTEN